MTATPVCSEHKIANLMQGSDFNNVSIVPKFDVNQFDLGDVFISPCRAGTYNEARDSFCKDCTVCQGYQYEREECIQVRNRVCVNCTICTEQEQQICQCNQRSPDCFTGDSVCLPLPPTSANITFDLSVSLRLSALKERFLQEGLRTGFVLFLSEYLQHPAESIVFMYLIKTSPTGYVTTFIVNDVYSLYTKSRVAQLTQSIVQTGLTSTFGVQSNTFSTVSEQRRRRLLQAQTPPIILNADAVTTQCIIQGTCGRFFVMKDTESSCNTTCVSLPCPPGYTGFYGSCEMCPNATYKPSTGNESCTQCPVGALSDQGSTDVSQCWIPVPTTTPPLVVPATSNAMTSGFHPRNSTTQITTTSGSASNLSVTLPARSSSVQVIPPTQTGIPPSTQPLTALSALTSSRPVDDHHSSPAVPTTAPSGGGGMGGVWPPSLYPQQVITNNNYLFNVSFIQHYLMQVTEWNSGKAGTVQYIIINERRDEWAVTMVGILMVAGFFSLAAIGARVFFAVGRPNNSTATGTPQGKTIIPLPIILPKPSPVTPEAGGDDDSSTKIYRHRGHVPPEVIVPVFHLGTHHHHSS